jgi:hypothetical protein
MNVGQLGGLDISRITLPACLAQIRKEPRVHLHDWQSRIVEIKLLRKKKTTCTVYLPGWKLRLQELISWVEVMENGYITVHAVHCV